MKKVWIIALIILVIDQIVKFYIKLNFELGKETKVFEWFRIEFTENPGAATGILIGGPTGKIVLSILRICLIIAIIFLVGKWSKIYRNNYFLIPAALVLAGAIGNMLDGAFYGLIFDKGTVYNYEIERYIGYGGLATANFDGYTSLLQGCVVDMFHFPLFEFTWPDWMPIYGGKQFKFFNYIFNVADAAITVGMFWFFLFRGKALTPSER